MTLKNFWTHRGQNAFIFVEILLTATLSFFALDAIIVTAYSTYIARADGEFEKEHLLVGEVKNTVALSGDMSRDSIFAPIYALRDHVQHLPEVQSVSLLNEVFLGRYQQSEWDSVRTETDTSCMTAYEHRFVSGEHFFETLGLTPSPGSPSAEDLSEVRGEDNCVISRSLAARLFGTEQAVGRRLVWGGKYHHEEDQKYLTVCGVVEDVKSVESQRYFYSVFIPIGLWDNSPFMFIRLKSNADWKAFVARYNMPDLRPQEGAYQLTTLETYKDYTKRLSKMSEGHMLSSMFGLFLSILFLNVMLGTLGTFWLQIRKRTEDIGIMRSFGAKRRDIFKMIWREAALLTFVACFVGQAIWLQFAMNDLIYKGGQYAAASGHETDWVMQFWPHFLIVSGIQYLLMLAIVTLGILIPSLIAMYKKPVDALRYE
ncbi:MAG: FtsX-like permease family protein [Bacteroidaceae bacterium]|nr:FtsX-like permease family protein [Bacteroidaceae bacterium]